MPIQRCPNCNGTTILSADRTKRICEYCASEFKLTPNTSGKLPAELLLTSDMPKHITSSCSEFYKKVCEYINEGYTAADCINELRGELLKNDWATPNGNLHIYDKIMCRLGQYFSANEVLVFYRNNALFSSGNTGIAISNKSFFLINTIGVKKLDLCNLVSIHYLEGILLPTWYFNYDRSFYIMPSKSKADTLMMVLLLITARDCIPPGRRIEVLKGVDERS